MPIAMLPLPDQAYLREILDYDPATGVLRWRERSRHHFQSKKSHASWNGKHAGQPTGYVTNKGRKVVGIDWKLYLCARVIWKWMTGEDPPDQIDHINCDRADDRWSNLRLASGSQNQCNAGIRITNTTGFKGVVERENGKYRARIGIQGKRRHLGTFDTPEEAHAEYCAWARRLHGEFKRYE